LDGRDCFVLFGNGYVFVVMLRSGIR